MEASLPPNEAARLAALHRYAILDTPPELSFDRITRLAARLFAAPVTLVSLVDRDRQWFKSRLGFEPPELPRCAAFCAHTILENKVLVVPDARADDRFADNALVTAAPFVRFYAGAPLTTPDGYNLGALVVIDSAARPAGLDAAETETLADLAALAVNEIERRVGSAERRRAEAAAAASERRYQRMVENTPGMVYQYLRRPDGTRAWPFVGQGCRDFFGVDPAAIQACPELPARMIHPEDRTGLEAAIVESMQTLRPFRWEGRLSREERPPIWVQALSRPERQPDGNTLWDGVMLDITEHKQAEEALRKSEEHLREALHAGAMVVWRLDPATGRVSWQLPERPDLSPGGGWRAPGAVPATEADFLRAVHPEDRAGLQAALALCKANGAPVCHQYRYYRPSDGALRWLEGRGRASYDAAGRLQTIVGLSMDVTARKEQETLLRAHTRQQAAVARLGQRALEIDGRSLDALCAEATRLVVEILGADFSSLLEHLPAQRLLTRRAAHGLPAHLLGLAESANPDDHRSVAGYTMQVRQPVVREDMSEETRFQFSPYALANGGVAVASVIVAREATDGEPAPTPFGVLNAVFRRRHVFPAEEVAFLQAVANILAAAVARQRAEALLEQARREADRANAAKSDFLSRMSHELRTPLNVILGFGQVLEMGDLDPDQRESVAHVLTAGRHLLALVDEVLDIARIESGRVEVSFEAVTVAGLLRESLDLVRPLAAERGIRLELVAGELTSSGRPAAVRADRQRLQQVLLNLLSNAVKYNAPGGRVRLEERPGARPAHLRLRVADSGPGISAARRDQLFLPFERLGAEHGSVPGTGLGLALSKRLVEMMGGELGLEAPDPAAPGAVFWVELPLTNASPRPGPDLAALPPAAAGGRGSRPPAAAAAAPDGADPPRTVLYVEDNASNLCLVERLLPAGPALRLVTARRGEQGLRLAREHRPDLVLLDLHLPDLPGHEVLERLRADETTRTVPVVIVSADATPWQVERLRRAGADAYLTKPLLAEQFLRCVGELLGAAPVCPAPAAHPDPAT